MKIGLVGASGKMGQSIQKIAHDLKGLEIVFLVSGNGQNHYTSINEIKSTDAKIVVDFSTPQVLSKVIGWCKENNVGLVSGTTGIDTAVEAQLKDLSLSVPVLWAPNMSIGINVMCKLLRELNNINHGLEFEIVETHHNQKKDSPSGTALLLQKNLSNEVPMHSLRIGGVFGVHEVVGAGESEVLTIKHEALNREVFASGAVQAAMWLGSQPAGKYSMEDFIG